MTLRSQTRRRLLKGASTVGAIAALEHLLPSYARAREPQETQQPHPGHPQGAAPAAAPVAPLSGSVDLFNLAITEIPVTIGGRTSAAQTVNGTVPGPILRLREGNEAVIRVENRLAETASIHWHGLIVPFEMDGVPGVSFAGIKPGTTFEYRFPVKQSGTYWYHSHSGGQELRGVYGPIIIDPIEPEPFRYDRDYVVMISDWSLMMPETIMKKMKQQPGYFNFQKRTVGEFLSDARRYGLRPTVNNYAMWARMRMDPTDFADVTGYAYSFLMNGMSPEANWTGLFKPGERVRLRVINAATMTIYDLRIPGLKMSVVQVDGQNVSPVSVDEFRIAPAETYDVIVEPTDDSAYTVFAEPIDRSGFARGTLAPREGMSAPIPERRPRPLRTMSDMGMDMGNMEGMAGMEGMSGMSMDKPAQGQQPKPDPKKTSKQAMPGMDHESMPGTSETGGKNAPPPVKSGGAGSSGTITGSKLGKASSGGKKSMAGMPDMESMNHSSMPGMRGKSGPVSKNASRDMNMKAMPTPGQHQMAGMSMAGEGHEANLADIPGNTPVPHGPDHHGPGNQAIPMVTRTRLNEPGTGLENNGRRVLVYTDLRALVPYPDQRPPGREIELHLTGNMERQIWGFDGKKYSEAPDPIEFRYNERLRLTLVNDTMMEHPIHLHGMWFHLENGHGELLPRKHTILVKPAERVSLAITADAPGQWAMHCHLLFHMEMGMFRVVKVIGAPPDAEPGEISQPSGSGMTHSAMQMSMLKVRQ